VTWQRQSSASPLCTLFYYVRPFVPYKHHKPWDALLQRLQSDPHPTFHDSSCRLSHDSSFTTTCLHAQMASVVVREVDTLHAAPGVRSASFAVPADDQAPAHEPEWRPPAPPAVVLVDVTGGEWRTLAVEDGIEAVCCCQRSDSLRTMF
jgi:hypothetical protein